MQACSGVDVHVEGMEMPLDFRAIIEMPDQLGFAHPSGRGEQDVRLIGNRADQPVRFRLAVTEVRGGDDAGDVEWIHRFSFWANIADSNELYKSYYRNSIILKTYMPVNV